MEKNIELTNNGIQILYEPNMRESIETSGVIVQASSVSAKIPGTNGIKVYKCSINDSIHRTNALFLNNEGQEISNFNVIRIFKTNIKLTQKKNTILIVKKYQVIERLSDQIIQNPLENYAPENFEINNLVKSNCNSAAVSKSNNFSEQTIINGNHNNFESKSKNTESQLSYNIIQSKSGINSNFYNNSDQKNLSRSSCNFNENFDEHNYNSPSVTDNNNNIKLIESFYDIKTPNKPTKARIFSTSKPHYLLLSTLSSFTKEIYLKVRVMKKTEKRIYGLTGRTGSVFSFTIMDEEGTEFPCTAFNHACERYYDLIQEGKTYEIKGGYIKINDKKFNTIKSEYKFFLDDKTTIKEIPDDSSIQKLNLNFVKLEKLKEIPINSVVDLLGFIIEKGEAGIVHSKKRDEKKLLKIIICDDSQYKIDTAIWGKHSETDFIEKSVYAFKNVKVSQYQNKKFITAGDDSLIILLESPEALEIKKNCEKIPQSEFQEILIISATDDPGFVSLGAPSDLKHISDVIEALDLSGIEGNKTSALRVKAIICGLTLNIDKLYYPGCPHCRRKVNIVNNNFTNDDDNKEIICEICRKFFEKPILFYTLNFKIKDLTGELFVDVIGQQGEKVLFGKTAEEFKEFVEQHNEDELRKIASEADYLKYYFLILPKINVYNDIRRKKYSVIKIDPVDTTAETQRMINDLKKIANI